MRGLPLENVVSGRAEPERTESRLEAERASRALGFVGILGASMAWTGSGAKLLGGCPLAGRDTP